MNLNLKSNGAIAKYLGLCTYQPTYHPASFCSLFWMLGFSPVIFAGCSVKAGALGLVSMYDTAIDNSQKRKARALVEIYLADPIEALQDFKENFVMCAGDIKALRDYRIVDEAFRILAERFGDKAMRYYIVIEKLGAVPADSEGSGWTFIQDHPYRDQPTVSGATISSFTTEMVRNYENAILVAAITFVIGSLFSLLLWTNILPFLMALTVIPALLITLFYRLELNVVAVNLYRGIKTKTCPIIKWEE